MLRLIWESTLSTGPNPETDEIFDRNKPFLSKVKDDVDAIIDIFGGRLAKELELSSMIVFIINNKLVDVDDDEAIVEKFLEIKPHYQRDNVLSGLSEIKKIIYSSH